MTARGQAARSLLPGVLWAAALYAVLTIVFAYPLSVRPGSTVFGDNPDTHFYIWTLSWDVHAFLHQPLSIFDANIYYPNRLTLAYSENQIGSALFAAPILWLTGNPVLAVNLVALLGCTLCGVGAYVLARRIGLDARAAFICGLVFAFAPARFVRTGQAYLGTLQWIPLALASLHGYFQREDARSLRWAAAFFTLQALTSGHGAVLLTLAALGLVVYRLIFGESLAPLRRLRDLGITGALVLLPSALIYVPYRRVQIEMGLRRSLQDWAPSLESFFAAPTHFQRWVLSWMPGLHVNENASAYLFPGYLPLLLAGVAIASRVARRSAPSGTATALDAPRRWASRLALIVDAIAIAGLVGAAVVLARGPVRVTVGSLTLFSIRDALRSMMLAVAAVATRIAFFRRIPFGLRGYVSRSRSWWSRHAPEWRDDTTVPYALLTLCGVWISIGPPLGLWPLIYWLPGLSFIRLSSRFMLLTMLGLAVLSGIGAQCLMSRVKHRHAGWLATSIACLMCAEFASMPLPVAPYTVTIPAIDRWLATQPTPFVVAEFPATAVVRYQTTYMLHSMAHWQKTIHGYSGFEAPLHTQLYQELRGFPDAPSVQRLRELGVTYMVVHEELYQRAEWSDMQKRLLQFGDRLTLEHTEGAGRVYSLRPLP